MKKTLKLTDVVYDIFAQVLACYDPLFSAFDDVTFTLSSLHSLLFHYSFYARGYSTSITTLIDSYFDRIRKSNYVDLFDLTSCYLNDLEKIKKEVK